MGRYGERSRETPGARSRALPRTATGSASGRGASHKAVYEAAHWVAHVGLVLPAASSLAGH